MRVVGAEPAQGVEEEARVGAVDAGVDLFDGELRLGAVAGLDDAEQTALVAGEAPVASRVVKAHAHHGEGGGASGGVEHLDALGRQQGHVAGQDVDIALEAFERGGGAAHGVSGAELFVLDHRAQRRLGERCAEVSPNQVALVADDDHDGVRADLERGAHRIVDEGAPGEAVQDLDSFGAHPGPEPRGHDHHGLLPLHAASTEGLVMLLRGIGKPGGTVNVCSRRRARRAHRCS